MPTIRQLKRRITSVKNTAKITNALQLVAASKMRRAQDRALQAQPYAEKLRVVLAGLAKTSSGDQETAHPLLEVRPVRTVGILHITPDRGLCGGLNANLNRSVATFAVGQPGAVATVAVGKKGRDFLSRAHFDIRGEFTELGDYPAQADTLAIARLIISDYLAGSIDRVFISYSQFVSTANQRPVIRQLLPIEPPQEEPAPAGFQQDYIFEPSPAVVLQRILPRYIEMQIYEAILQTAASFQSAQMVAMKNATDNAQDMTRELTLSYNKARQEQITKELLDIVGGAAALGG